MKEKKSTREFLQKEIQKAGNVLLLKSISDFRLSMNEIFWEIRDEEDQKDRGIDFQVELIDKRSSETINIFKIQNKGTDRILTPKKGKPHCGYIPFQLKLRNAQYYRYQIPVALIFTLSDVKNNRVYWYSIQLDNSIDERISKALEKNKKHLQVYLDPNKVISLSTERELIQDVLKSYQQQMVRYDAHISNHRLITKHPLVDLTLPLIDQLFEYFQFVFKEIPILPVHQFIKNYPFKESNAFQPYYKNFIVTSDNSELCELLESIRIDNGKATIKNEKLLNGVSDPESKLAYIIEKLNDNLIFYFNHYSSHKSIDIRFKQRKPGNDLKDSYYSLDFSRALLGMLNESQTTDALLQKAFLHFEFGNYLESAKLYEQIASISDEKQQFIQFYVAKYNLSLLHVFIRMQYFKNPVASELEKRLSEINTKAIFSQIKNADNEKLISWIENFDYYNSARRKVSNLTNKIRDVYNSQLKGGWSTNTHVNELINEYVLFINFLLKNQIPFTRFNEFTEITDEFLEGLFASHAITDQQTSRLEAFDDTLLSLLVIYSAPEKIFRWCNRYNLKGIHYSEASNSVETILNHVETLLSSHNTLQRDFEHVCEKGNRDFWMRYNTIFSNALVLMGLADLSAEKSNDISSQLLSFLNTEDFIRRDSIRNICFYLKRKAEYIDRETLYGFLKLFISNSKYHDEQSIGVVIQLIVDNQGSCDIDQNDLDYLLTVTFRSDCSDCHRRHDTGTIVKIYQALGNDGQKSIIRESIIDYLSVSFDPDLFHNASIGGVLEYNNELFAQFLEVSIPTNDSRSMRSIFSGIDDNRYLLINKLFELCLLFGIDTSDKKFDCFKAVDPYYQWLFDMINFDYASFDPKWLSDYYPPLYLEAFGHNPTIIVKLADYIRETSNQHLTWIYFKIEKINNKF